MTACTRKIFVGPAFVLMVGLGCCPTIQCKDARTPQPRASRNQNKPCWHDPSVLNVRRIFPSPLSTGELPLLEVLKGSCKPQFDNNDNWPLPVPEFNRYYKCTSDKRRIVYRDPHTGRLLRTLTKALPRTEVVDDVRGLFYTTLVPGVRSQDPPLLRHGPARTTAEEIHVKRFTMGRVAKIWRENRLLRTIRVASSERIACAKLLGPEHIAICVTMVVGKKSLRVTNSDDQISDRSVYDERLLATGSIRVLRVKDGKQVSAATFQYRPVMRAAGPCAISAIVPQGVYDSQAKPSCAAYYKQCHAKMFSPACGDKWYTKRLPRSYDLVASVSPSGEHVAVLAFDDLHIFRIPKPHTALKLVAKHTDVTYLNRDYFLSDARMRWSTRGSMVAVYGEGRVVRMVPVNGAKVVNFKVRGKNLCRGVMCEPQIGSVFVDAQRKLFVHSRPDFGIGINWLKMALNMPGFLEGGNMTLLDRRRVFATLPMCRNCGGARNLASRDIVVVGNTMLLNAGGVLLKVALDSKITECSMGVRTVDGEISRW